MSASAPRVFVSYRRGDSPGHAGRIRDALVARFGDGNVFYDMATVKAGANFAEVIEKAMAECTVVLAIIGPRWRRAGRRRSLLGQNDWVSTELNLAGRLQKPVLPVLVNSATGANLSNLPGTLSYLSSINAFLVRDESWDTDIRHLLEQATAARPTYLPVLVAPRRHGWRRLLWIPAVLALAALGVMAVNAYRSKPTTPSVFVGTIQHTGEVRGVAFSRDAKWIAAAGGNSHTVTLWDAGTGKIAKRFPGDGVVSGVAFSQDGNRIATDAEVFDIDTGERLFRLASGGYAVAFSPDGRFVANASGYAPAPGVRIFDYATGKLVKQISHEYASAVAFNHDATLVAAASGYLGQGVRVWSVPDYALVRTLAGPSDAVAFSADGKYVATQGGGTVRVFRAANGESLRDIPGRSVSFSPDGRVLATTGENLRVRLYNPANGDAITTLDVFANTLAFSPDGQRIVTAGPDGSVEVASIASTPMPTAHQ